MRSFSIWIPAILTARVACYNITTTGQCSVDELTCDGSTYGACCSQYGWCGGTTAHCGAGCQPEFGACNNVTAPVFKASPNARCGIISGATGGYNCLGSEWGDCCSRFGWCGSELGYCGVNCQVGFGKCNSKSRSSMESAPSSADPPTGFSTQILSSPTGPLISNVTFLNTSSSSNPIQLSTFTTQVSTLSSTMESLVSSLAVSSSPAVVGPWASPGQILTEPFKPDLKPIASLLDALSMALAINLLPPFISSTSSSASSQTPAGFQTTDAASTLASLAAFSTSTSIELSLSTSQILAPPFTADLSSIVSPLDTSSTTLSLELPSPFFFLESSLASSPTSAESYRTNSTSTAASSATSLESNSVETPLSSNHALAETFTTDSISAVLFSTDSSTSTSAEEPLSSTSQASAESFTTDPTLNMLFPATFPTSTSAEPPLSTIQAFAETFTTDSTSAVLFPTDSSASTPVEEPLPFTSLASSVPFTTDLVSLVVPVSAPTPVFRELFLSLTSEESWSTSIQTLPESSSAIENLGLLIDSGMVDSSATSPTPSSTISDLFLSSSMSILVELSSSYSQTATEASSAMESSNLSIFPDLLDPPTMPLDSSFTGSTSSSSSSTLTSVDLPPYSSQIAAESPTLSSMSIVLSLEASSLPFLIDLSSSSVQIPIETYSASASSISSIDSPIAFLVPTLISSALSSPSSTSILVELLSPSGQTSTGAPNLIESSSSLMSLSAIDSFATSLTPSTTNLTSSPSSAMPSAAPSVGVCDQFLTWSVISTPPNNSGTQLPGIYTDVQCCKICQDTAGCTYWAQFHTETGCHIFTQTGATTLNQCPSGLQDVEYYEGTPAWGPGPCGKPSL